MLLIINTVLDKFISTIKNGEIIVYFVCYPLNSEISICCLLSFEKHAFYDWDALSWKYAMLFRHVSPYLQHISWNSFNILLILIMCKIYVLYNPFQTYSHHLSRKSISEMIEDLLIIRRELMSNLLNRLMK